MIIRLAQEVLSGQISRRFPMLSRIQRLKFAAAGSVVACMLGTPAQADELAQNLGPVGPHEPILTEVGSERVMAFYEPDNGRCAVHAVVFDKTDAYTGMTTAVRVRVSLNPREMVHIDSADNELVKSLSLQCGENAEKLTIIDTDSLGCLRHRHRATQPTHQSQCIRASTRRTGKPGNSSFHSCCPMHGTSASRARPSERDPRCSAT